MYCENYANLSIKSKPKVPTLSYTHYIFLYVPKQMVEKGLTDTSNTVGKLGIFVNACIKDHLQPRVVYQ